MSQEKLPKNPEQSRELESIRQDLEKIAQNKAERELTKAESEHGKSHQVEQLRYSAEKHALDAEKHAPHQEKESVTHPISANKQLKDISYQRALTRTRKKLSAPSRVFSKVVHNKAVDAASEVIGNSVARPSSMLGGALFAFIGTSMLLWLTKRLGYEYNYLLVIVFFAVGMAAGLVIEAIIKARKSLK